MIIVWNIFLLRNFKSSIRLPHNSKSFGTSSASSSEIRSREAAKERKDTTNNDQTSKTASETVRNSAASIAKEEQELHIIFSTDCSFFQDYQSIVVFHSAMMVKQHGSITRIASGCDDNKKIELKALYQKLYPQFHVHFTPDFKMDAKTKKKYDFYNKPFGVEHWIGNAEPPIRDGVIVALIDPDFIFLRPLTTKIAGADNSIYLKFGGQSAPTPDSIDSFPRVEKYHPAAQLYGLGAPWTNDRHKHFNRTRICGDGSPCQKVKNLFGERHYRWSRFLKLKRDRLSTLAQFLKSCFLLSVGPPYILEKEDLHRLAHKWTEFVPR